MPENAQKHKRWKCVCAYDGTDFLGWQSQRGGKTIQDIIEARLAAIFKKKIRIHGSGRTDAGVHAKGQVFHFDADWEDTEAALLRAFRSNIPDSIQVSKVSAAQEDFHARFSARKKRYAYNLFLGHAPPMETRYAWSIGGRYALDAEKMQQGAKVFLGKHDFTAFSAKREDAENPIKELYRLDIYADGPRLRIVTEGSGYLYKMVRTLVGTIVEVGRGKLPQAALKEILKSKKRTPAVVTAPAKGLSLERVFY